MKEVYKNNKNVINLKKILLIIGILAIVSSLFLTWNKIFYGFNTSIVAIIIGFASGIGLLIESFHKKN